MVGVGMLGAYPITSNSMMLDTPPLYIYKEREREREKKKERERESPRQITSASEFFLVSRLPWLRTCQQSSDLHSSTRQPQAPCAGPPTSPASSGELAAESRGSAPRQALPGLMGVVSWSTISEVQKVTAESWGVSKTSDEKG